jgi:hypothetical protein
MPETFLALDNVTLTAQLKKQMEAKYFELKNQSK